MYLYLTDEKLEFRDATHLWGNDTGYTEDKIREELDQPKAQIVSIADQMQVGKLDGNGVCRAVTGSIVHDNDLVAVCLVCADGSGIGAQCLQRDIASVIGDNDDR